MISITGALVAEHRMFCAVFDQIGKALPGAKNVAEIRRVARLIEGLLLTHAKTEDDLILMAARHLPPKKGAHSRLQNEHIEVDARLRRVYLTDEAEAARKLLKAAMAASRRHFDREERLIFPILERYLEPDVLERLGTMWFLRKHAPANWTL